MEVTMKLSFLSILTLIFTTVMFNFSHRLNHFRNVFLVMPKTVILTGVNIDDTDKTPYFNRVKTDQLIGNYYVNNINLLYSFDYTITYFNDSENVAEQDEKARRLTIYFSAPIVFNYIYEDQLSISLTKAYA